MNKIRNSNIELLRIVLIFFVITLHFINGEMGGASNYTLSLFGNLFFSVLTAVSVCAVNCFMIISGYFLSHNRQVKIGRILNILLIVIFYNAFNYFFNVIFNDAQLSVKRIIEIFIPANYFAIFYIGVYIFSPFVTVLFDSISNKQQSIFLIILVGIFVVWSTIIDIIMNIHPTYSLNSISFISSDGDIRGYSFIQFFVDFCIGVYFSRKRINIKSIVMIVIFFISTFVIVIFSKKIPSICNYSSVFTVVNAGCLFLLFNKLHIQSSFVNFVSKSVFGIFCCHVGSFMLSSWSFIIAKEHFTQGAFQLTVWSFVSIFLMFLFCFIIDIIYRFTFGKFTDFVCSKCNILFSLEEK